jgi:hypothetical protein
MTPLNQAFDPLAAGAGAVTLNELTDEGRMTAAGRGRVTGSEAAR